MRIAKDITELIGNTPLVYLNKINPYKDVKIAAKLEYMNPGKCSKDVIAVNMIKSAEREGKITPGKTTLIEPTSGNTGIALAYISAVKGYKMIITMPEHMSDERKILLKAFGAEIVLTPANLGIKGSIDKAKELAQEIEDSYILYQFQNPANPEIHREETAEEIWKDTAGNVDIIVAGVGTGGTITGLSKKLKSKRQELKSIAVEPLGCPVLSGGKPGTHKIDGIGVGFIPKVLDVKFIDEVICVSDSEAIETTRRLAKEEGLLCGVASGAAAYAAIEIAKRQESKGKLIVVIFTDSGERYLSKDIFT